MDNKTQERIKADAERIYRGKPDSRFPSNFKYIDGYIAGATAEHDRAQVLVDALEALKEGAENHTIHFIDKILKQWKSGKGKEVHVELSCMVCGATFMGPKPQMCCSGRDCGCMGMPIDPIVCSKECYDKGIPPQFGGSGVNI